MIPANEPVSVSGFLIGGYVSSYQSTDHSKVAVSLKVLPQPEWQLTIAVPLELYGQFAGD